MTIGPVSCLTPWAAVPWHPLWSCEMVHPQSVEGSVLLAETFPLLNFDTPHTAYKILPHLYAPSANKILEYMVKMVLCFPRCPCIYGNTLCYSQPCNTGLVKPLYQFHHTIHQPISYNETNYCIVNFFPTASLRFLSVGSASCSNPARHA